MVAKHGQQIGLTAVGLLTLGLMAWPSATAQAQKLPGSAKAKIEKIQNRLNEVEGRVGFFEKEKLLQTLEEQRTFIKELAYDSFVTVKHPELAPLMARIDALKVKVEKTKVPDPNDPKSMIPDDTVTGPSREDLEKMVEVPINFDNISFKRHVAPIVRNVCMGCHSARRARGDVNLSTFSNFKEYLTPGKPEDSHAFQLVKTGRMPQGGMRRFTKEWLKIWETWIKQGAKYDGPAGKEGAPISDYYISWDQQRAEVVAKMSTADVSKMHEDYAAVQIQAAKPSTKPTKLLTDNFIIYTTLPESDHEYLQILAEFTLKKLKETYGLPADKAMFKGRLGLNIFTKRADYVAFSRLIDNHAPEPSDTGHLRFRMQHQYVVFNTEVDGLSMEALLGEWVTKAFLQQLSGGKLPAWAVHGYSRYMAYHAEEKGKRSQVLKDELTTANSLLDRDFSKFFDGELPWVETAPISVAYFHFMMTKRPTDGVKFVKALARGTKWKNAMSLFKSNDPKVFQVGLQQFMKGPGRRLALRNS